MRLGGKFTLSDDSHGIAQLATNYGRAIDYLESLGVDQVWTLERGPSGVPDPHTKSELAEKSVSLAAIIAALKANAG